MSWRDFLEVASSDAQRQPGTKTNQRREPIYHAFGSLLKTATSANFVSRWRDKKLPVPLPESIVQEVLWELFELNFRSELFALDSRASTTHRDNLERADLVNSCFSESTGLYDIAIPEGNCGLVSDDWRERRHFLMVMVHIMSLWEWKKPVLLVSQY